MKVGLDLKKCVENFGYFAEHVLGLRLWPGQRKAAGSTKFITAIAAPRRSGKSTLLVALAIWTCFREPGARVVIVSAAESSAKDRIEEALLLLARSPLTAGCTADEGKTKITFRNSSVLLSRPASPRAIRGLGQRVMLVILDESSLIDESVWTAAMFLALDHKAEGARILVADVPWGSRTHWYRRHFTLGEDRQETVLGCGAWPSTLENLNESCGRCAAVGARSGFAPETRPLSQAGARRGVARSFRNARRRPSLQPRTYRSHRRCNRAVVSLYVFHAVGPSLSKGSGSGHAIRNVKMVQVSPAFLRNWGHVTSGAPRPEDCGELDELAALRARRTRKGDG